VGEMHTTFESVILNERDNLKNLGTEGRIVLKYKLKKWVLIMCPRSVDPARSE
jgi:hypothetical protein